MPTYQKLHNDYLLICSDEFFQLKNFYYNPILYTVEQKQETTLKNVFRLQILQANLDKGKVYNVLFICLDEDGHIHFRS